MPEVKELVRVKEQHVPLEKFIRQETEKFEGSSYGFKYATNEKIERKIKKYDKLLSDIDEVKGRSMTNFFCAEMDYKQGEYIGKMDSYRILRYVIKAATHYIRIKSKKNAHDDWIGYVDEIKSAKNVKFVSSGKWGYDYTLSLDGEEVEASTHPSNSPYYWIFKKEDVIGLMEKDNIQLCSYGPLTKRAFGFEIFSEEKIPAGTVEMVK